MSANVKLSAAEIAQIAAIVAQVLAGSRAQEPKAAPAPKAKREMPESMKTMLDRKTNIGAYELPVHIVHERKGATRAVLTSANRIYWYEVAANGRSTQVGDAHVVSASYAAKLRTVGCRTK